MFVRFLPAMALAGLWVGVGPVLAQDDRVDLDAVVVLAKKVQPEAVAKPLTVVGAQALSRRQASTLGETLRGLPGVSATGFGSNASRPILRGQDGDRVKILQNSAPVADASAMSFDHAMGVSPYALERVEILRGPAALLYGGSAVGGVVNLVNRRIVRERLSGANASVDLRVDSSNDGRLGAFEWEAPIGQDWYGHVDGFAQKSSDTRVPRFTDNGEDPVTGTRVRNSAAQASGLGVGLSKVVGSGHWGMSIEADQSQYGVPKEVNTTIDMDRRRLAFSADQTLAGAFWQRVRLRAGVTDYQHEELEQAAVMSLFKNRANDARLELSHQPIGVWNGLVGLQWEYADFDVTAFGGEDPLMPRTVSPKLGLFLLEETSLGSGTLRVGGRVEQARVKADRTFAVADYGIDGVAEGAIDTGGAAQRRSFTPVSLSVEYTLPVSAATNVGWALSHVQRAPSSDALFAMGVHHASGLFEAGNALLDQEKGNHMDVTVSHAQGDHRFKGSVFYSRYANYLTLIRRTSGDTEFFHEHEPGEIEGMPVYDYSGVGARFYGLELEYGSTHRLGSWLVAPSVVYDYVAGKRTSSGAYIPRLTPQRLTPSVDVSSGPWLLRGQVQWVGKAKLGEGETVQAGAYTLLDLLVEYRHGSAVWFVKGTNLTNRLAFQANTVDAVRQFVPLAGRAVQAGVRAYF